jgi:hypothetical protein
MAITHEQVQRFVRDHGKVTAWLAKSQITMLPNGEVDSVAAWERDAERFEFNGKSYTRDEFETLLVAR